jgi:pimeloyl-ACP methyl ester carboxylesterase
MDHKTLISELGTVHYWTSGAGEESIIFTHGATMDHAMFQTQMDEFASSYRVICWDVPAHGLSRPYAGFTLQKAAHELVRILDAEQIERAHLVGQSMGGYISQMAALDFPARVCTLTALDSSPIQPSYYSALDNWLLSITPPLLRLYPYRMLINTIAKQIALTPAAREYALRTLAGYSRTEIAMIMKVVYQSLQVYKTDFLLPQPLLIVYGDADRSGKVQAYSRQWAQREGRALEVIPQASHNANMDNPEMFNQLLEKFLEEQRDNEHNHR